MILIDALNVRSLGGLRLLEHLSTRLSGEGRAYRVQMADKARDLIPRREEYIFYPVRNYVRDRADLLDKAVQKFEPETIVCLGNFPPSRRYPSRVITSFQNILIAGSRYDRYLSLKERLSMQVRRIYLKRYRNNTDLWVVPTDYVAESLVRGMRVRPGDCRTISFYDASTIRSVAEGYRESKNPHAYVYVGSCSPHKNHARLLKAWHKVLSEGHAYTLRLITDERSSGARRVLKQVQALNEKFPSSVEWYGTGGSMDYVDVLKLQAECQYTVYPSLAETFGYGTIEGALLGNQLIISDRPFFKDVVVSSLYCDPLSVDSIRGAIIESRECSAPSEILFKDDIEQLIALL